MTSPSPHRDNLPGFDVLEAIRRGMDPLNEDDTSWTDATADAILDSLTNRGYRVVRAEGIDHGDKLVNDFAGAIGNPSTPVWRRA